MKQKSNSESLKKAKKVSNNEFYTYYEDIEKELNFHINEIKCKVVYCCCDNPAESNFFKFLFNNYKKFELKGLKASHFINQQTDLFCEIVEKPVFCEFFGEDISYEDFIKTKLKKMKGDGDLRKEESVRILKTCDIVITNPPFSIIREVVKTFETHNVDFLIIAPMLAASYLYLSKKIANKSIRTGKNKIESFYFKEKKLSVGCIWLTSLKTKVETKFFKSSINYYGNEEKYEVIDKECVNGKFILNINKERYIPDDYFGLMFVPISFILKINTDQFYFYGSDNVRYTKDKTVNNRSVFKRLEIQRRKK